MNNNFASLLFLLLILVVATPVTAGEVRISAAASLTEALKEIVAGYQQNHSETRLLPNFASSGALAKQISAGAPADIYISANPKWMDHLQQQGLVSEASEQVLLRNSLVFVGRPGAAKSLRELPQLQRIALGSPKSTPVGRYAEQAMSSAGLYRQLQSERKLILTKDVRQALLYADRGEVDGAFVYQTDALLARQAQVLFVVPQDLYPQVVYPAALTEAGAGKGDPEKFFAYLFGDEAKRVFEKYGFGTDL